MGHSETNLSKETLMNSDNSNLKIAVVITTVYVIARVGISVMIRRENKKNQESQMQALLSTKI